MRNALVAARASGDGSIDLFVSLYFLLQARCKSADLIGAGKPEQRTERRLDEQIRGLTALRLWKLKVSF